MEKPTGREKNSRKTLDSHDKKGLPLAAVLSGANTHDMKPLARTLNGVVVLRPEPSGEAPQKRRFILQRKSREQSQ